jgi:ADP-heptose:LPS heptosyltransferase
LPLEKKYPQRFFNLQGKTSLMESAVLAQNAFRVIGNDTGIPHLAEAVGTPALFILGPTGEQFGFYPHLPLSRALFKNLWCRPCTTNGKGHCIRSERFCLTGISVEQVKSEIDLLLKDNPVAPSSTLLAESRQ